ncbi:MAG: topoisomerase C-terminal repeat-containing protein [Pirellulaceae bacterium]
MPRNWRLVYIKQGRFGVHIQLGVLEEDSDEKPKNASLLPGMDPGDVDLDLALKLLALPRDLGEHPELKEHVMAYNGKFGPYIKCGSETRSLPAENAVNTS